MPIYNFRDQNEIGISGENTIKEFLRAKGWRISDVDLSTNKSGIDFYMNEFAVEVKTDSQAYKTGNIFVETISNSRTGQLGWVHKTKSDFVLYFIPEGGYYFELETPSLRHFVLNFHKRFKKRTCKNETYNSEGYLVKISDIEQYFPKIYLK